MSYIFRVGLLVLPLLLLHFPNALMANGELLDERNEEDVLEHVQVTATRTSRRDIDIAAAVTTVDEEEVLMLAPDVIAEMLRGEPGTFFQQTTPGQGIPIIRGLKGSQVLHMVDGMRLNNAFFRNAPNQYLGLGRERYLHTAGDHDEPRAASRRRGRHGRRRGCGQGFCCRRSLGQRSPAVPAKVLALRNRRAACRALARLRGDDGCGLSGSR